MSGWTVNIYHSRQEASTVAVLVNRNIFTKFGMEALMSKWTHTWRWWRAIVLKSCGASRYKLVSLVDKFHNRTVLIGVAILNDEMRWETGEIPASEQLQRGVKTSVILTGVRLKIWNLSPEECSAGLSNHKMLQLGGLLLSSICRQGMWKDLSQAMIA